MIKMIKMSPLFLLLLSFISLSAREYSIVPYDNLWNLSKGFYQTGFEWQRIWKANPYIMNPDLIYPGDVLIIPGVGEVTVKDDGTYQVRGITFDDRVASLFSTETTIDTAVTLPQVNSAYIDKKIKEYLLSESAMLTIPYIHKTENAKGLVEPGFASLDDGNRKSYMQYATVKVSTDDGTGLTGGSYTLVQPVTYLEYRGKIVNLVKPVGFAEVRGQDSVFITKSWDMVYDSARIVPNQEISIEGGIVVKEDASPLEVKLLSRVKKEVIYHQYEMIILAGGQSDGLRVGDLFDAYLEKSRTGDEKKVDLQVMVVKVQAETATAIVTQSADIVKDGPLYFNRIATLRVEAHSD